MIKNIPVYFYMVASFLAVIAMVIGNEWMMILSKPSIIPALLIYYYSSDKKYTSPVLLTILFIYFASDSLVLLNYPNITLYLMIIDFIPYVLLAKVVLEDAYKIGFYKKEAILSSLVFLGLMVVMTYLLFSLSTENGAYLLAIIVYGIVLASYVCASLYNYLVTDLDFTMYILIAALFGLIADVIFIITNMVFYVEALNYIEFVLQIISYFYIVAYFIKRDLMVLERKEQWIS